jgi:hypothetical protein
MNPDDQPITQIQPPLIYYRLKRSVPLFAHGTVETLKTQLTAGYVLVISAYNAYVKRYSCITYFIAAVDTVSQFV